MIFFNLSILRGIPLFILMAFSVTAQKKDAYEMMVDGVKVIVQPSNNEIVEVQTIIKGGVQNYPFNKQGIESLAMSALTECGTKNDDKNSFKNKLEKVSAQVYAYTSMDYASINMNCIKSDLDAVWPLYADAITAPDFNEKEFIRIKQDAINNLKSQESTPDYAIRKMAKETAFKGMNYSKTPDGTEQTVSTLTVAETRDYYQSILTRSRIVMVVVGEIDKGIITQKISGMLAKIAAGKPYILKKELYHPMANSFGGQKKEIATNYIQGITGGPAPGTADYNAFVLAMRIFGMKHFVEVRTKNGLSYAPGAYFDGGTTPSANITVSTTDPNKYIGVAKHLIETVKKDGFTEDEVKNIKTSYLTQFFYRQETNNAQANSFAANEVLHNNWKRALTINDDLKKVSVQDVNNVFRKYIGNFSWSYQGDPVKVDGKLFTGEKTTDKPVLPKTKLKTNKKG